MRLSAQLTEAAKGRKVSLTARQQTIYDGLSQGAKRLLYDMAWSKRHGTGKYAGQASSLDAKNELEKKKVIYSVYGKVKGKEQEQRFCYLSKRLGKKLADYHYQQVEGKKGRHEDVEGESDRGLLDEGGLSAAERKAGKVDARKMSEKEVLGLLADGKQVVVTKKMAHRVPAVLQPHGLVIRSFWAGPRSEWHGLALVGSKEKAAKLKAVLKEALAVKAPALYELPDELREAVTFVENAEEWLGIVKEALQGYSKATTDRARLHHARSINTYLGTLKMALDKVHPQVGKLFGKMRKAKK